MMLYTLQQVHECCLDLDPYRDLRWWTMKDGELFTVCVHHVLLLTKMCMTCGLSSLARSLDFLRPSSLAVSGERGNNTPPG